MIKRKIVVVSLFSGMDLFLLACVKAGLIPGFACERNIFAALMHAANFKTISGDSVIEFIEISKEEYDYRKQHKNENAKKDLADTFTLRDGKYVRTKSIEEVNGFEIRSGIEKEYGKNVIIILIGGPPCQDFLAMNKHKTIDNGSRNSRNFLIFEYLRILSELNPDVALMEQTPSIGAESYEHIFTEFIEKISQLPFKMAFQDINSIHYQGNQSRERRAFIFVNNNLNASPVFPTPVPELAKRVRDFIDIDYFFSGHFTDGIKNKNHFMCTVTSGSPKWLRKGEKQWAPSIDELLLCMDVQKGEYIIPSGLPTAQIKKAIGNGVCVSMGRALITSVSENILRLKPDGDGYWIPIDTLPNDPTPTCNPQEINLQSTDDCSMPSTPIQEAIGTNLNNVLPEPVNTISLNSKIPVVKNEVKPKIFYESGFVLYEGKSLINGENIVVVLTLESVNEKTGNMAQLWILTADINPLEAVNQGKDVAICGQCNFRQNKGGACYVFIGKEPLTIWKAWKNSAYPKLQIKYFDILSGMSIRFGAYGDPYAMPLDILTELKKYASNHTCYTHQWKEESASAIKSLSMASIDNTEEYKQATKMGWRTFRVKKSDDNLLPGEILCANETSGVQCKDCSLCNGSSSGAKNIAVNVHGTNKKKFNYDFNKSQEAEYEILNDNVSDVDPITESEKSYIETLQSSNTSVSDVTPISILPELRNVGLSYKNSKKIISCAQLKTMQFQSLNFQGKWDKFFGLPSISFYCILHGLSGEGKSTFAIQFANYLANNFGKVIYISGEEGFSKTFKDKFIYTSADSVSLEVADLRTYDDIIREVRIETYNFIFIDSLDCMKIDAEKMKKIRTIYKNSAIISISQSTKDGQMRGSYEIVHDSDIAVKVENGIATTTKNRFQEKGTTFNVFEEMTDQQINPVNNIDNNTNL